MLLFVNACARAQSRTLALAHAAAAHLAKEDVVTLNLFEEDLAPLDGDRLTKREALSAAGDFEDEMFRFAKQFRDAEEILIAAPYWDLSFPAVLKCYLEAVCVCGLTFVYGERGIPVSLCSARRLIYVTTAGGFIPKDNFGYDYVRRLCTDFFGVKDTVCIKAEGLDIDGADVPRILAAAAENVKKQLG